MCICDPSTKCVCSVYTQPIETPKETKIEGAKVYSLDTFRRAKSMMTKEEAIKSSTISKQSDLDTHFLNIEYLKTNRFVGG